MLLRGWRRALPLRSDLSCVGKFMLIWVLDFRFASKFTYTAAQEPIFELVVLVLLGIESSAWPIHVLCICAVTVEAGSLSPWSRCRALGGMSSMVHHFFSVACCLVAYILVDA